MVRFVAEVAAVISLTGVLASESLCAQANRNVPLRPRDDFRPRRRGPGLEGRAGRAKALVGGWDEWVQRGEKIEK